MTTVQKHKFSEGFILDEKKLRQICEILNRRLATLHNSPELKFQLSMVDSFSYTTEDIQKILKEENAEDNEIKELIISIDRYNSHGIFFEIKFDNNQNYPTYLEVRGDDQVLVSSIFYELKQYLLKRVNTWKGYSTWIKGKVYILFMSLVLTLILALIPLIFVTPVNLNPSLTSDQIDLILKNKTTDEKIDFIIKVLAFQENEKRASIASLTQKLINPIAGLFISFPIVIFIVISIDKLENYINYFFPRNVFFIGEGKKKYEQIQNKRSNIFWMIIVALAVSLFGGWVLFLLTK